MCSRRIAVLGDMLELGDESAALHRQVGKEAATRVDTLMVLGEMARYVITSYSIHYTKLYDA